MFHSNKILCFTAVLLIAACSDDDNNTYTLGNLFGGPTGLTDKEEITVEYVNHEIENGMPPPESYTASGTVLVHDDGYQGNGIDIGRVILSRIDNNSTGETLAVAFSYRQSVNPADGTFSAFYIDTDNNPDTGEAIEGIGADALILDLHTFDTEGSLFIDYTNFHIWTGTQWNAQNQLSSSSTASYYEGLKTDNAIFVANNSGIVGLLGTTNVSGVMAVRVLPDGDPNSVQATVDTTTAFSFDMP